MGCLAEAELGPWGPAPCAHPVGLLPVSLEWALIGLFDVVEARTVPAFLGAPHWPRDR